jgi:hypothetical protein
MNLQVTIYNSAGEIVKHLYNGDSQFFTGFSMSGNAIEAGASSLTLLFGAAIQGGANQLVWLGTNDANQYVSGGIYTVQVKLTNSFGQVSSWTQSVSVMPPPATQNFSIFNSAGELVYSVNLSQYGNPPFNGLGIGGNGKNAFAPGNGNFIQFVTSDSNGNPVNIPPWYGFSSSGQLVASGSYVAELVTLSGAASSSVSKGFIVIEGPQASFGVSEGPNPIGPGQHQAVFEIFGMQTGQYAAVKVFGLDGELVGRVSGNVGSSLISIGCDHWAAGIYVAEVDLYSGNAVASRKICMIAVDR